MEREREHGFDGGGRWVPRGPGGGAVTGNATDMRLSFEGATANRYIDAEIDDVGRAMHAAFSWRPPLRLALRARASHTTSGSSHGAPGLLGTAGFGFWNEPFMVGQRGLRLPEAVWFFYTSPPSQLWLVPGVQSWGWKAQVVHARRPGAVLAALPTLAALGWARLSHQEQSAERWLQRLSGASEQLLPADLAEWHTYQLDWLPDRATFSLDGQAVLAVPNPPRGPLGFVAWIDNQFAIVTPRGQVRFGLLATGAQWLEIADLVLA